MNLNDVPTLLQTLISVITFLSVVSGLICKKIWESVSVQNKTFHEVRHIVMGLSDVNKKVLSMEEFMLNSTRDRTSLHLELDDHGRRIGCLEKK